MNFFATCPKGLELLLVEELKNLGATTANEKLAGVAFTGDLAIAYKACLWSRLANRILLPIQQFRAETPEELYDNVQSIVWHEHVNPEGTIHVHFISSQSQITHTLFGAQKVKDAIVDQFRRKFNVRPSVEKSFPDLSVHVYLHKDVASVSIDLSGQSLHKRNIRTEQGEAPLKENLAAAILMRAQWQKILKEKGALVDPMCGSGTFLIEAAQIAANIAPGLSRQYFGFLGWKKHDAILWEKLSREAEEVKQLDNIPKIVGYDHDSAMIKIAFANIERAGLLGKIHVEKKSLNDLQSPGDFGLLVTNPPYGERMGELVELESTYTVLGEKLRTLFQSWHAAIFTGNIDLAKKLAIRAKKQYALFNGAIPCKLLLFDVLPENFFGGKLKTTD